MGQPLFDHANAEVCVVVSDGGRRTNLRSIHRSLGFGVTGVKERLSHRFSSTRGKERKKGGEARGMLVICSRRALLDLTRIRRGDGFLSSGTTKI